MDEDSTDDDNTDDDNSQLELPYSLINNIYNIYDNIIISIYNVYDANNYNYVDYANNYNYVDDAIDYDNVINPAKRQRQC